MKGLLFSGVFTNYPISFTSVNFKNITVPSLVSREHHAKKYLIKKLDSYYMTCDPIERHNNCRYLDIYIDIYGYHLNNPYNLLKKNWKEIDYKSYSLFVYKSELDYKLLEPNDQLSNMINHAYKKNMCIKSFYDKNINGFIYLGKDEF